MSVIDFPSEVDRAEDEAMGFDEMPMVMSPKTLAEILEVSVKTLERMRDAKTGPHWHKLPGSSLIRYARPDVIAWFAACRVEVTS
ncbi:helix-turn-helix domain-containing protein [Microbacterium sp. J1-1]|uniref:helix-turn-helix domain-containing protein n=1 Tax=Microbacterium sp. J1-1 TaxID=2992441 RepID=UPI0021153278|nr:helix-turn-helix domain-containing protein [Microbacterium sp. J1-1]UUE19355.1 helix-turn-helix domain-containing protein [Microbacterium sp. J1-1]